MIRADGLRVVHGDAVVLDDVHLAVDDGELVVLTGEDGSGTSTLLRALGVPLLDQPPGSEWQPSDVVQALAPDLSLLGAEHLADREMWTLSGGERQRVRLCRALASSGDLVLDEPLGYLDGPGVRVLRTLRERADAGAAVLLVAKGDERAYAAADRVLVLADGRVTARGAVSSDG